MIPPGDEIGPTGSGAPPLEGGSPVHRWYDLPASDVLEALDLVLADHNFATIRGAVEEGRIVAVGSTVIVGGELDKWWNRRRARPLG